MQLVREAGIPPGVVNLLIGGAETGDALVRHPVVQKVSFTGGPPPRGRSSAACAESLKPAVLELGGKSANLVFPDADLEAASLVNAFSVCGVLAGQGCAIPSRMLVHDDVYDEVADRVVETVRANAARRPVRSGHDHQSAGHKAAQQRVLGMIERPQAEGAGKLLLGGGIPAGAAAERFLRRAHRLRRCRPGQRARTGRGVRSGPVAAAILDRGGGGADRQRARRTGSPRTSGREDAPRISRLSTQLRAGGVYVNGAPPVIGCELPFGGVGISGFGREGGQEGLFEFVRTKAVAIA